LIYFVCYVGLLVSDFFVVIIGFADVLNIIFLYFIIILDILYSAYNCYTVMIVKANKVVPLADFPASKNIQITLDDQKYVVAPTTLE